MILAGDVGGTNARVALFERVDGRLVERRRLRFPSRELSGFEEAIDRFGLVEPLTAAGFGAAGPVRNGRCEATNLPWVIDSWSLAATLGLPKVALLNDLAANAVGLPELGPADLVVINAGEEDAEGNGGLISAGTGLGEAYLHREPDGSFRPLASEGGHTSFAPRDEHEIELLRFLTARFGHVSYERILSGPGIANLYAFERETSRIPEPAWLTEEIAATGDPAPPVFAAAQAGTDDVATRTLDRFVGIYGAEAGNLALKAFATGGVFVGGGIAPRIRERLLDGAFFEAFCDKGRFGPMLAKVPLKMIVNDSCALLGAARAGEEMLR